MSASLAVLVLVPRLVAAFCECGYSATSPGGVDAAWLFTDQLESDFTKAQDIRQDTAWQRQEFNVSAEDGRGEYAKTFMPDNVLAGADAADDEKGDGQDHGKGGLDLRVGSKVHDEAVSAAEIDSSRQDLHWGSYRAGMKITDINGTCASFFWYFNDTQEIDIEFLSKEFDRDNKVFPINLVVQTESSMKAGFDASDTGTYKRVDLTFDPTAEFHEYRFDYVPGHVFFYADSQLLADMQGEEIPSSPGHLILQHWSNGNPLWSGGPPDHDALLTVSYVKAYFNSSDPGRQSDLARQCAKATGEDGSGPVCVIPDVTAANASSGGSFFSHSGGGGGGAAANDNGDNDDEGNATTPGSEKDDEEDADSGAAHLKLDGHSTMITMATLLAWTVVMTGTVAMTL